MQAVKWCDRGCSNWFLPAAVFWTNCRGQKVEAGRFGGPCRSPGESREEVVKFWMLLEVEPSGFAHKAGCVW